MTKQEKIREGLLAEIKYIMKVGNSKTKIAEAECYTDTILVWQASQDVVIAVGGISEDLAQTAAQPETYYAYGVGLSWERSNYIFKAFKDARYKAVVPLIKEVNND